MKCLGLYARLYVSVRVTKCSSPPISPSTFPSPSVMSPPDVLILSKNTSGTMLSSTISSTMAQLPIFGKNVANSAPYGHPFHYQFHFQIQLVAQFQQQHSNVFQATVSIWTASGMYIFVKWPTIVLDNIHHTSCHLLYTFAAQIILCFKTKAQLGGKETTFTLSTCCKRYDAQNTLSGGSRIFCLSSFFQHTHDNNPLWILHSPCQNKQGR